jgi:uncharacterized protein (TIGR03790 family)
MYFGLRLILACGVLLSCGAHRILAGGSGLNVLIVVNQNSSNSVALGNYYAELRRVPPQNLLRMSNWNGGVVNWNLQQFTTHLRDPLHMTLRERRLTNQVNYVLLSMDIPYRIVEGNDINSTTSALFYGFKTNGPPPGPNLPGSCSLPGASSNAYAGSEFPFREVAPGKLSHTNLLPTMVTASNLHLAKLTVYHGTISDSSFPTQTVYLAKSTDTARNIRYKTFDRATFDTRLQGNLSMIRFTGNSPPAGIPLLGTQTGFYSYGTGNLSFVPGALADNLTSYGGAIFQDTGGHLNILSLLAAGASGSYGTLDEPCAYLEKFPTAQTFYYQARGFNLAEAYYQGVTNPYQGLLLGDPLAAPFAIRPTVRWAGVESATPLTGIEKLTIRAESHATDRPVGQVCLYTNGVWMGTLASIAPRTGDRVTVKINEEPITWDVPAGASIGDVAMGLAEVINNVSMETGMGAELRGDRIELRLLDPSLEGADVSCVAKTTNSHGTLPSTRLHVAQPRFLDSIAHGTREFRVEGNPTNAWLRLALTRTNGVTSSVSVTNTSGLGLTALVQSLLNAINLNSDLVGTDGVAAEDLVDGTRVRFNLRARAPGWRAAQIEATLEAHPQLTIKPTTTLRLDENVTDLQPRNHLYVSSGDDDLLLDFLLDTTQLGDGFHELTAVAIEGTHVQAQGLASQQVRVQNNSMEAVLVANPAGTNVALETTVQFHVTTSGGAVDRVELFSTGGSQGAVTGPGPSTFQVSGTSMGAGLHPFYAVANGPGGQSFRTETVWIRFVEADVPFRLIAVLPGPTLSWPATAGRVYTVLRAAAIGGVFEAVATVTATNGTATWTEPGSPGQTSFYRVKTEF